MKITGTHCYYFCFLFHGFLKYRSIFGSKREKMFKLQMQPRTYLISYLYPYKYLKLSLKSKGITTKNITSELVFWLRITSRIGIKAQKLVSKCRITFETLYNFNVYESKKCNSVHKKSFAFRFCLIEVILKEKTNFSPRR